MTTTFRSIDIPRRTTTEIQNIAQVWNTDKDAIQETTQKPASQLASQAAAIPPASQPASQPANKSATVSSERLV